MPGLAYQHAMEHPLILEAIQDGVAVRYDVASQMYLMAKDGWGQFAVSVGYVEDLTEMLGSLMGWQFLRHGTTVQGNRLLASRLVLDRWMQPWEA